MNQHNYQGDEQSKSYIITYYRSDGLYISGYNTTKKLGIYINEEQDYNYEKNKCRFFPPVQ